MKGLDLKKLKKVSSDDKMTVFKHDMGHEIKIVHGKLSPKMRAELEKIPLHGQKPQKMADGGMPNPQPNASPDDTPQSVPAQYTPGVSDPGPQATVGNNPNNPAPIDNDSPAQTDDNQQPDNTSQPGDTSQSGDQAPIAGQSVANASQIGQPQIPTAGQVLTQPTSANDAQAYLNDQAAKLRQDFGNGQITPKTYHDFFAKNADGSDRGTLGKIGLMFSMLAGGMGSGLTHQPNVVLGMMDKEIDRDLEAQKQSRANQFSALNLAENHYNNLVRAHYTQQLGKVAEQNTAFAKANTDLVKTNQAKNAMYFSVEQNALRTAGMLPENTPAGQKYRAATGMLSNAITQKVAQGNQQVAQQIELNGQQSQQMNQQAQPDVTEPDGNGNYILGPNAEHMYNALKYLPISDKQKSDAADQYNHAVQVEKALKQIDQLQPKAAATTTVAGSVANAIESGLTLPLGSMGEVDFGKLPGEAVRDLGGQKEKLHEKYKTQLKGYIESALQGTGATPTDIEHMAQEYMPKESEGPEVKAASFKGLKDKLINLTKTGAMPKGMLREK